jgi:hypothetical protein
MVTNAYVTAMNVSQHKVNGYTVWRNQLLDFRRGLITIRACEKERTFSLVAQHVFRYFRESTHAAAAFQYFDGRPPAVDTMLFSASL